MIVIQTIGKCVQNGHDYIFKAANRSIFDHRGPHGLYSNIYYDIIEACKVCGYEQERTANKKEKKALSILNIKFETDRRIHFDGTITERKAAK